MTRVNHTRKAREELLSIWTYIAADNVEAADRLLDSIDEKCTLLAENPRLGPAGPDIAPGLRYFPIGRYFIFYQEISDGVQIVRVLHGARNLRAIFHADE